MRDRGLDDSTCTMLLNTVTECARISATLVELFSTKRSAEEHIEMTHPWMKRDVGAALWGHYSLTLEEHPLPVLGPRMSR
jgi:hypothetical protein